MEVSPQIRRIEAPFENRRLCLYVMETKGGRVLVDTGLATTPETSLFPYLRECGLRPEQIDRVIVSHADFDHFGGNGPVREAAPNARFLCHPRDEKWICDPEAIIREKYAEGARKHGFPQSAESAEAIRRQIRPTPMDELLEEGDARFAPWELLHLPGHTPGHIGLYHPERRIALIQDALLGAGIPDKEGNPAFPPPYRLLDGYLDSIRKLEERPVDCLLTAHYPVLRGAEAAAFVSESRAFAERLDRLLRETLEQSDKPLTLKDLIPQLAPRLGHWREEAWGTLRIPLMGHLESLISEGAAKEIPCGEDSIARYEWIRGGA